MASVDSYGKRDVKGVLKEHERTATTYKNEVDPTRTHLNWGYGASNKSADEVIRMIRKRCNKIMDGREMPNNTNIMCDWCVTYPFEYCTPVKYDTGKVDDDGKPIIKTYNKPNDMAHCKKFFDTAYEFACNRYGKENVFAGYVHMDETTPHIDINFVPEAISRKNGQQTVSSASLLTKGELSKFHKELDKEMELTFGQKGMILNGRTKGNYTVSELKQRDKDKHDLQVREENVQTQESALLEQAIFNAEYFAQMRDELVLKEREQEEDLDSERADVWLERKQNARDSEKNARDREKLEADQQQFEARVSAEVERREAMRSRAEQVSSNVQTTKRRLPELGF